MDLISQIVATKVNVEVTEVQNDLDKLSMSAESVKKKMKTELNSYPNLLLRAILINTSDFLPEVTSLINSALELEKRVKDLVPKDGLILESEAAEMLERIQNIYNNLLFFKSIQEIESLIKSVEDIMETDHLTAAVRLMKVKSLITKYIKVEGFENFFKYAVERYIEHYATLKLYTIKKWNEIIVFKDVKKGKKSVSSSLTLAVKPYDANLNNIFHILQVLRCPHKEEFQQHFFDNLLYPVLNYSCNIEISESCNEKSMITIEYSKQSPKMSFKNVVYSLIQLFKFLNVHLDLKSETDADFIMYIGLLSADEFINLFIQEHLSVELNSNSGYNDIVNLTKELLTVTKEKGFVIKNNKLDDYLASIPTKYEGILLSQYMNSALSLLKRDLFDMMHVKAVVVTLPMSDMTMANTVHTVSSKTEFLSDFEYSADSDKYQIFPECKISKSIDDLVRLLKQILDDTIDCDSTCQAHLFKTANEIVYAYLSVYASNSHQLSVPQHSALVFNNCMYLIMSLIDLDKDYHSGFLFCGLNYKLRNLGFESLNQQVLAMQSRLSHSLHKIDLGNPNCLNDFPDKTNNLLRESLLELTLLKDAWINILPTNIYCMAVGYLCNGFIDEIMSILLSVDQIESDSSNHYLQLFSSVKDKISQMFQEKSQVEKYVRSWGKFHEMHRIFEGNLASIKERWDDGCGPLSVHFTNLQIRNLIIAIFPPNEMRQTTLESIL